jgi:hypothetical protein
MKYTGINPSATNRIASGSLGVFVENTRVGTFGTDSLVVSGSTVLSSSLEVIGEENLTGSLNVSGSAEIIGALNTIGSFLVTGSSIISSSLSVIGEQSVEGVLQAIGSFFTTGSAIISSSLSVIGTSNIEGTSLVTGSSIISGSLTLEGPATITGSALITGSADIQGNTGINGILSVTGSEYTSGSTDVTTIQGSTAGGQLFNVLGTSGQLFSVTDGLSGSLFSVNTISGLPLMEIFSDETVNIGRFGVSPLKTVGALAQVTGSLTGSVSGQAIGPFVATGSSNVLSVQGTGLEATIFDVNGTSGQLFSVVDGLSGSLFSVNTISGVPVMEVFSDNTIRLGQYSAPPLIISSSFVIVSGSSTAPGVLSIQTGSLIISRSGSASPSDALFDVEGAQGQLFSVIDSFSGSLMSVNDISGFPILEVFSDDKIVMGTFGSDALVVDGTQVAVGVTSSGTPSYNGLRDGEFTFGTDGGTHYLYVWMTGSWRSSSLA